MALKVGDITNFYDLKAKRKVKARIGKIIRSKGRKRATGKSSIGHKLSKFIK